MNVRRSLSPEWGRFLSWSVTIRREKPFSEETCDLKLGGEGSVRLL